MKKEIPILFSTPMVQAILEGRKTQTRRIMKQQPDTDPQTGDFYNSFFKTVEPWEVYRDAMKNSSLSPYGKVGDILWVRETTRVGWWNHEDQKVAFDYKASPEIVKTPWCEFDDIGAFDEFLDRLMMKLDKLGIEPSNVDEENETFHFKWEPGKSPFKWTPAIHMLKIAARIWLDVVSIKVERLHDITEADSIAEGVEVIQSDSAGKVYRDYNLKRIGHYTAKESFQSLWESINGSDSWNLNPWVWVIEFKRVTKPI